MSTVTDSRSVIAFEGIVVPQPIVTEVGDAVANMKTAQDLLDWISDDPSLPIQQRRNEKAAVTWLGRVDKTPLPAIPLEVRHLVDDRIRKIRTYKDLTPQRRSNIVSLLNGVFLRSGILMVGARRSATLSFEWWALSNRLPDDDARNSLGTFARFCSDRDVEPQSVTLDILGSLR